MRCLTGKVSLPQLLYDLVTGVSYPQLNMITCAVTDGFLNFAKQNRLLQKTL